MNLLLSAYACRPNIGSEPAVGWKWAIELSKYCNVTVLTNYTNEPYIRKHLSDISLSNINFVYVKPNMKTELWYKEWQSFERLYYMLWQRKAVKVARDLMKSKKFDCVQHITYVSCVMPTYMYKLNLPFVYGPVSGGEAIPSIINYPLTKKEKLIELIRQCNQVFASKSIYFRKACKKSKYIITTTEETKKLISPEYHDKTKIEQAIGLNKKDIRENIKTTFNDTLKFLIAGRMLSWKGFKIALEAFVEALDSGVDASLTILGSGNEDFNLNLQKLSGNYLNKKIKFVKSVPYNEMNSFYDKHDILINCSLRDSGCLVVMEAMGRGLPIICIDTGGPKVNTCSGGAIKIQPQKYDELKKDLIKSIIQICNDKQMISKLSQEGLVVAKEEFEFESKVKSFYEKYLQENNK